MTLQVQLQSFANSIRAPQNSTDESAETQRRMDIYRTLFFNNVAGFIQNGFPVLHSLYNEEQWQALILRFFIEHQCSSPYFIHISKEFVEYLSNEYQPVKSDPPFMAELAHYEWLELALSVREVEQPVNYWQQVKKLCIMKENPTAVNSKNFVCPTVYLLLRLYDLVNLVRHL